MTLVTTSSTSKSAKRRARIRRVAVLMSGKLTKELYGALPVSFFSTRLNLDTLVVDTCPVILPAVLSNVYPCCESGSRWNVHAMPFTPALHSNSLSKPIIIPRSREISLCSARPRQVIDQVQGAAVEPLSMSAARGCSGKGLARVRAPAALLPTALAKQSLTVALAREDEDEVPSFDDCDEIDVGGDDLVAALPFAESSEPPSLHFVARDQEAHAQGHVCDPHLAGAPSAPSAPALGSVDLVDLEWTQTLLAVDDSAEESDDHDDKEVGRLWALLRRKTVRELDKLENIGSRSLGLLLKHIVDAVLGRRADAATLHGGRRILLEIVAARTLDTWSKYALWRLLPIDYQGLVQTMAEDVIEVIDDLPALSA